MQQIDLRSARKRRRMDQETLAERSGVDQSTVSRLERGGIKKPTPETVDALERALRLKPGTLVFGDQDMARTA
jgi:transcriptional regulator with XRE-family HTH domain